jgi:cysteinyl-tRNA synthetase
MKWPSDWSEGFPGWHLECSVMGTKYLGNTFDIHGGGMDLLFPHHECEIAQSVAANGTEHVKYWMHNNMITINGQKMARSLNNFITLNELFTGNHKALEQAYSPMTVKFFILQAHYRSTLDFSNDALISSQKGLLRLMNAIETLDKIKPAEKSSVSFNQIQSKCLKALFDDINTPVAIAQLFDGVRIINQLDEGKESITKKELEKFKDFYSTIVFNVLGISQESDTTKNSELTGKLMDLIIELRQEAKSKKDFITSDDIRKKLNEIGITIKDTKDGAEWEFSD